MDRAQTLRSEFKEELFAVADFIVFNDPAIRSYLVGEQVSSAGRKGFEPLAPMCSWR